MFGEIQVLQLRNLEMSVLILWHDNFEKNPAW